MSYLRYRYKGQQLFRLLFLLAFVLFTLSFNSCSKERAPGDDKDGDIVNISINVDDITAENTGVVKQKSMSIHPVTEHGAVVFNHETFNFNDIELDVIAAQGEDVAFGKSGGASAIKRVKKMSAVSSIDRKAIDYDTKMREGVKFMFVLKNKQTGQVEQAMQGIAGTTLTLPVVRGKDYFWYAYSYNTDEDLAPLDRTSMQVETRSDTPFLRATGSTKVGFNSDHVDIKLTFKHQLQRVKVHLDTRGLYADMTEKSASFVQDDYVKTGFFDISTGSFVGALTSKSISTINFKSVESDSDRQFEAEYYTADLNLDSYAVKINALKVRYVDGADDDLSGAMPNNAVQTFSFSSGAAAQVLYGHLKLYKKIGIKKILHIEGNVLRSHTGSQANKASGGFLRAAANFSATSNYVRMAGFEHDNFLTSTAGALKTKLSNRANYPDIIIADMFSTYSDDDYDALYTYLQKGGAVFLMIDSDNTDAAKGFFQKVFNSTDVNFQKYGIGGYVYRVAKTIESDVTAWPFGDIRDRYWGADDVGSSAASPQGSSRVSDIPANELNNIITYTKQGANDQTNNPNAITMFRHKHLNLFFVGNRGFLANEEPKGQVAGNLYTSQPFATDDNHFPVGRINYGVETANNSDDWHKYRGSWTAYNSMIFGNILAHFIGQVHFKPVDRTP